MRKASLVHAKAHLSELVDAAEHHGTRIIILRHGKPAAAIVPVSVAAPSRARAPMSISKAKRSVAAFVADFGEAEPEVSAVDDLIQGRR